MTDTITKLESIIDLNEEIVSPTICIGYLDYVPKSITGYHKAKAYIKNKVLNSLDKEIEKYTIYISCFFYRKNWYWCTFYANKKDFSIFKISKDAVTFLHTSTNMSEGILFVHDIELHNIFASINFINKTIEGKIKSVVIFTEDEDIMDSLLRKFSDKIPTMESLYVITYDNILYTNTEKEPVYAFI